MSWDWEYPEDSIDWSPIESVPDPLFELPLEVSPGYFDLENWSSTSGGDGTGPADFGKLTSLLQGLGGGGGGSTGSGGILDILKAVGLTTGNSGAAGALLPLLSLLAGGYGLNQQNSNTEDAAKQLQAGAEKSNALATDLIGGARSAFTPYQEAGTSALGKMQAMVGANNMADKFGPVGTTSALGDKFKGAMTLKQLMGK